MEANVRLAKQDDLHRIASFVAEVQFDPDRHCVYLGLDESSIAADIAGLDGWTKTTIIAEDDHGIAGVLVPDVDDEMGRVWWWGPFAKRDRWAEIADALYRSSRQQLPSMIDEEEVVADAESSLLPAWAGRHGFIPNEASVLLRLEEDRFDGSSSPSAMVIRPAEPNDFAIIASLHNAAFPSTHSTAEALMRSDHPRMVAEHERAVVGYVAYEVQSDGTGYIDYLAVDPAARGAGVGGQLVCSACTDLFARDVAFVHLTVRAGNAAARALYRRVGFHDERIAVPYRRGFDLDGSATKTNAI